MFDILIAGGLVVAPEGPRRCDVAVRDGRIAALAECGILHDLADEVIPVEGSIVIPGSIDPHVHCNWPIGEHGGEPRLTAGPDVVSRAAAFGGTTTLIDFAIVRPDESLPGAVERHTRAWLGSSICDFSFHVLLQDVISEPQLREIPELIRAGFPSYKVFLTNVRPSVVGRKVAFGSFMELLRVTAGSGIIAVHAEDDELVMHTYDKLIAAGDTHYRNMPVVHSSLSEELSFRRSIRLAQAVPGAALYMMHVSTAAGVAAIEEHRRQGQPVYGETLHQYALLTQDRYDEPDGMKYHNYPSLKTRDDVEALWHGVVGGAIATFATDELCTSLAEKTLGDRIDNVTGGNTGIEPRLPLIYTELVSRRGMSLQRFVEVTSTNAARILGLYPHKGALAVGSDADIVVLDPRGGRRVRADRLHESDYTPWEGWDVDVWPSMTLIRGRVVVRDEELVGDLSHGRLVERALDPAITAGPGA